ncbi:MAG: MscL family protein, partial [Oscillospiraceae bacterium]|nr:MscL family protein [Oscillospiraceae bacterium]
MARGNSFIEEIKNFMTTGNSVYTAVGVIIGAALQNVSDSLVSNIIMPIVNTVLNGAGVKNKFIALAPGVFSTLSEAESAGVEIIDYGNLIGTAIYFCLLAVIVYAIIKAMNKVPGKSQNKQHGQGVGMD